MCFSAAASFTAAGVLGVVSVATFAQRPRRMALPLAAMPSMFAIHQFIEGFVWLSFQSGGSPPDSLIAAYLFIAQVFWPAFTPLAVLLMEREPRRRIALYILLFAGLIVSSVMAWNLFQHDYSVGIVRHSLNYGVDVAFERRLIGLYLVTTTAPLLISRHRYVMAFGATVLTGSVITDIFFYYASASVWCFFAALSSMFVYLHFRREARLKARKMPLGAPSPADA
jgi:hypothetical protein